MTNPTIISEEEMDARVAAQAGASPRARNVMRAMLDGLNAMTTPEALFGNNAPSQEGIKRAHSIAQDKRALALVVDPTTSMQRPTCGFPHRAVATPRQKRTASATSAMR